MTETAVAPDVHQTLDVLRLLAAEVTLAHDATVNVVADLRNLVLRQILDAGVLVHTHLFADLRGGRAADAVDVRKANLNALLAREVDAKNTCQRELLS